MGGTLRKLTTRYSIAISSISTPERGIILVSIFPNLWLKKPSSKPRPGISKAFPNLIPNNANLPPPSSLLSLKAHKRDTTLIRGISQTSRCSNGTDRLRMRPQKGRELHRALCARCRRQKLKLVRLQHRDVERGRAGVRNGLR